MKKATLSFILSFLLSCFSFSQEKSELFMKYSTIPLNNKIEVYINFIDNKVNKDKPFTYYDVTKTKKEISSKDLKKDLRLRLKKNKEINDNSYFITLKGFKELQISANYNETSNMTSIFFRKKKAWNNVEKIIFYYADEKERKLEKIKVLCKHIPLGKLVVFEYKK